MNEQREGLDNGFDMDTASAISLIVLVVLLIIFAFALYYYSGVDQGLESFETSSLVYKSPEGTRIHYIGPLEEGSPYHLYKTVSRFFLTTRICHIVVYLPDLSNGEVPSLESVENGVSMWCSEN